MYSVLRQEKTALRDGRGMTVYRRLYLCDTAEDLAELPVDDAPGSGAVIAEGGGLRILDHARCWREADGAVGLGGCLWRS
jgi:hypothetical protein